MNRTSSVVFFCARAGRYVAALLLLTFLAFLLDADAFGTRRVLLIPLLTGLLLLAVYLLLGQTFGKFDTGVSDASRDSAPAAAIPLDAPSLSVPLTPHLLMLLEIAAYAPRTEERIRIRDGYYVHDVLRDFRIPTDRDYGEPPLEPPGSPVIDISTWFIPFLRVQKGRLLHRLEAALADGSIVAPLNLAASRGLLAHLVGNYIKALSDPGDSDADSAIASMEKELARVGPLPLAGDQVPEPDVAAAVQSLRRLKRPAAWNDALWLKHRERLEQICQALGDTDVYFVPVRARPGEVVSIRYSHLRLHRPESIKVRDWLRYCIGLRPHEHALELDGMYETQSYKCLFEAPPEQYVYGFDARPLAQGSPPGTPPGPSTKVGVVVVPQSPSGALDHLQIRFRPARDPDRSQARPWKLVVNCREKPPGLIGVVAFVAVAQSALIWALGIFHDDFFATVDRMATEMAVTAATATPRLMEMSGDRQSDLPALLLALPGLLAGWLATQFTSDRLRQTSLATMVGIGLSGLLAIVTTSIALAKSARAPFEPGFGIEHPAWAILMVLSGGLAFDLVLRYVSRARAFARRMTGPLTYERRAQ